MTLAMHTATSAVPRPQGTAALHRSPHHEDHSKMGATFGVVGDWLLPLHYGSALDEYWAARGAAGVFDDFDRAVFHLAGPHTKHLLEGLLTNNIARLQRGEGCRAFQLDRRGFVEADYRVYIVDDREAYLVSPWVCRGAAVRALSELEKRFKVDFTDLSAAYGVLSVHGPEAADLLDRTLERTIISLPRHQHLRANFKGAGLLVAGSRCTGLQGYHIVGHKDPLGGLCAALIRTGPERGRAVGRLALEMLRVENGTPVFGAEIDTDTTPLESGLYRAAVAVEKTQYPGAAALRRTRAVPGVSRTLVGLLLEGEEIPIRGDLVFHEGREVGHVTSAVMSPHLRRVIAMATVSAVHARSGTPLSVECRPPAGVPAAVTALPFRD